MLVDVLRRLLNALLSGEDLSVLSTSLSVSPALATPWVSERPDKFCLSGCSVPKPNEGRIGAIKVARSLTGAVDVRVIWPSLFGVHGSSAYTIRPII